MAHLSWILTLICASGAHLSSASPVLRSALPLRTVQPGGNVSLTCNLTSPTEITWYLLRSDQLLPLLLITSSGLKGPIVNPQTPDESRISSQGNLEGGQVTLEIQQVTEDDAGLYLCSGRCAGKVCVDRGIRLAVHGARGELQPTRQPCWSPEICVLPASLVFCLILFIVICLCSGKPAVCCCSCNKSPKGTEDASLHYSSLKHNRKPRPPGRKAGPGLDEVTYSTVAGCRHTNGPRGH